MLVNNYSLPKRLVRMAGNYLPILKRIRLARRTTRSAKDVAKSQAVLDAIIAKWENSTPLFNHVEIETINRCNGTCGFCPVNANQDPRHLARMTDVMFFGIIDQLAALDYSGLLFFYSNNEPFLDDRIEEFIRYARNKLPHASLRISSNGTVLTPERYVSCIDNLDEFKINNYCSDFKWSPKIMAVAKVAESNPEWWAKTEIKMRFFDDLLTSRGGKAPNYGGDLPEEQTLGCPFPVNQVVVRPDGKLSLCCNDARGVMTVGDLKKQNIMEIWDDPNRIDFRKRMLQSRNFVDLCRYCNNC